jgi:hypothetical protein
MYFPYFIAYMAAGFLVSLGVLLWAVHRGQFRDQERARFLALDGPAAAGGRARLTRRGRIESAGLFVLVSAGLAGSVAVIVFALNHSG